MSETSEVVSTLQTRRGCAGTLASTIRSRRNRRLPLRLKPVDGTASKYRVYAPSKGLLGETVIRSRRGRRQLDDGRRPYLTIGWNGNRNETLQVHIPA